MELAEVVPWGRSYDEYLRMFSLSDDDLQKRILGVGDGPASFNAELAARGGRIQSADPVYRFSSEEIDSRIRTVYPEILNQVQKNSSDFVWDSIPDVEALGRMRMEAMGIFLTDFESAKAQGRYVDAALPDLPFAPKAFDLALCSHYLFLYSDHVDLEQHLLSMRELCRVASEVRIYPLVTLKGNLSSHLEPVMAALGERGARVELRDVDYEFQRGATQMLVATQG